MAMTNVFLLFNPVYALCLVVFARASQTWLHLPEAA